MSKKILIFSLLLMPFFIKAQPLTQEQFIQQLKQTHPFFSQQDIREKILKNKEDLSVLGSDWQANINTKQQYQQTSHLDNPSSLHSRKNTTNLNTSLSKKNIQTGEALTLRQNFSQNIANQKTHNNKISLDYTRPLWRNKDGINSRLPHELAKLDSQSNLWSSQQSGQDFLKQQLFLFIDLAHAQAQLEIHKKRLTLAKRQLRQIQQKFNASVAEQIDVLTQKDAILRTEVQLLLNKRDLIALRSQLATKLSLPKRKIVAVMDIYKTHSLLDIAPDFFEQNNYTLQEFALQKSKIIKQLNSNKDEGNPDLTLSIGVSKSGDSSRLFNQLLPKNSGISVGLDLSLPIKNTANHTKQIGLELELKNLEYKHKNTLLGLQESLASLDEKLSLSQQILRNNIAQINLATLRFLTEYERYENGLTTLNFVLSAQDNEAGLRLSYSQNAANYQKLYLEYQALLNQIN